MPRMSRTVTSRALLSAATRAQRQACSLATATRGVAASINVALFKGPPSRNAIRARRSGTGPLSTTELWSSVTSRTDPEHTAPRLGLQTVAPRAHLTTAGSLATPYDPLAGNRSQESSKNFTLADV